MKVAPANVGVPPRAPVSGTCETPGLALWQLSHAAPRVTGKCPGDRLAIFFGATERLAAPVPVPWQVLQPVLAALCT